MIAKPEWFVMKRGFTGKIHFIPAKLAGWLYYLGVIGALFVAEILFSPLVIIVLIIFIADMMHLAIQQRKK